MKYPKIETLFNREDAGKKKGHVIEGEYRLTEFDNIKRWFATEKVDGTNIRVLLSKGVDYPPVIQKLGRTDRAEFHPNLQKYLDEAFTMKRMTGAFSELMEAQLYEVWLFGEGYGPKIQKGGNYSPDINFRLFDVNINGIWLDLDNVADIAFNLDLCTVPYLGFFSTEEIIEMVKDRMPSTVASEEGGTPDYVAEGIVARTLPLLLTRRGKRLMFKLKSRDFRVVPKE